MPWFIPPLSRVVRIDTFTAVPRSAKRTLSENSGSTSRQGSAVRDIAIFQRVIGRHFCGVREVNHKLATGLCLFWDHYLSHRVSNETVSRTAQSTTFRKTQHRMRVRRHDRFCRERAVTADPPFRAAQLAGQTILSLFATMIQKLSAARARRHAEKSDCHILFHRSTFHREREFCHGDCRG